MTLNNLSKLFEYFFNRYTKHGNVISKAYRTFLFMTHKTVFVIGKANLISIPNNYAYFVKKKIQVSQSM